ncbi:sensor histidine kinase [Bradyrhizobium sp. USDA 3364]
MNSGDRQSRTSAYCDTRVRKLFLATIALLVFMSAHCLASDAPQRVLILHAYNYTFPATTIASEAARRQLIEHSSRPIEIEAEFLDLARFPGDANAARTAQFLHDKYHAMRFDLILAIGAGAVPFIIKYRDQFAPNVPVAFAGGTKDHFAALKLPNDMTGVYSGFDPDKILELAERMQPNARRLMVIGGSSENDRSWQRSAREAIERRAKRLEIITRYDFSYDALLAEVSHLPSDTIVLLLTAYSDADGRSLIPRVVATDIAKAASAPVYGPFETFLGSGVVGGYTETYASFGASAADVAIEILSGADPAKIAPHASPRQAFLVDARAMNRWGMQRSDLPPGTIVQFHEPGLWEQHGLLVVAVASVLLIQSVLLIALLFQRRQLRRTQRSLEESEDRMNFAATSMNIGFWQFNRSTGALWISEHGRVMFNAAKEQPLTRDSFLAAVQLEDRPLAAAALEGDLKVHTPAADVRVGASGDEVRWVRIRSRAHLDEASESNPVSGAFVDITDQKASESETELHRQEVAHLMRVSMLGELSGAIAHEVNQPLTAIMSNAQAALYLLEQDPPNLEEVREALRDIVNEDNRAGSVVRRLRGLLKKGESRTELIDINEMIGSATALLHNELISRRVRVETHLSASRPTVFGDSVQLQQVLLNLIINAMDAMASTPEKQRRICIGTRETKTGTTEIFVSDNGHGVHPQDGKRLFTPFYTTKDHGLGLGLTICSTIIRKHGGTINLKNGDMGGAVAKISLPARLMLTAAQ